MVRTRVGYAGGTLANPTYYNLGDHTETIEMDYDPDVITYTELLAIFWNSHDPTSPSYSRQYKSIIFYHDAEQKRLAEESKASEEARRGRKIVTEIVPYTRFYWAEDYHQKYRLRNRAEFLREYLMIYPDNEDFVNSTAVTRLNGYVGGNGTLTALEKELPSLGLSTEASRKLWDLVASYDRSGEAGNKTDSSAQITGSCPTGTCG